MLRNILLQIEYDGIGYFGWQIQKDKITVQKKIEEALEKLFRKKMRKLGYPIDDEEIGSFTATGLKAKSFISCAVGKMS